jgi:hypothetical protein
MLAGDNVTFQKGYTHYTRNELDDLDLYSITQMKIWFGITIVFPTLKPALAEE